MFSLLIIHWQRFLLRKYNRKASSYFIVMKDIESQDQFNLGFALNELFNVNSLGLLTKRDKFIIDFTKESIESRLKDFIAKEIPDDLLVKKDDLKMQDNDKWDITKSRIELQKSGIITDKFKRFNYRCFDIRYIYCDDNLVVILNRKVLNYILPNNPSLITTRQLADNNFNHLFY